MNPYTETWSCDICGGPGMARLRDTASTWLGARLTHSDPAVCAMYLEEKAAELAEKKLKENADTSAKPT